MVGNNIDFTWQLLFKEFISLQSSTKLLSHDKAIKLSSLTRVFHKLYHTVGAFNSWLIGLTILCLSCGTLFSFVDSWKTFFYLTLAPYLVILAWSLPLTRIGSWKTITSITHRLSGILSLLLPMGLIVYNSWTDQHPPSYLYITALFCIVFNCIFGALPFLNEFQVLMFLQYERSVLELL